LKDQGKSAVVLTADKFEDMEVFFPLFRLQEMGWKVDIAAPNKRRISGEHFYTLEPTTIGEVEPDKYDLLLIPGGFPDGAPATVRKSKKAFGDHPSPSSTRTSLSPRSVTVPGPSPQPVW